MKSDRNTSSVSVTKPKKWKQKRENATLRLKNAGLENDLEFMGASLNAFVKVYVQKRDLTEEEHVKKRNLTEGEHVILERLMKIVDEIFRAIGMRLT